MEIIIGTRMQRLHLQEKRVTDSVVVIGAGPVGLRFAKLLLNYNLEVSIILFGAEAHSPYDRVNLGNLFGDNPCHLDDLALEYPIDNRLELKLNCKIIEIDRKHKRVITSEGQCQHYSKLVMATGANAYLPDFAGNNLEGVSLLRTLDDALALREKSKLARQIIVLGAGVLGLEAALSLNNDNNQVHVLERNSEVRYLRVAKDPSLQEIVTQNLSVHTNTRVLKVLGKRQVSGVLLRNGQQLNCDLLLVAAGVIPDTKLAHCAALKVNRGVIVNDFLQTSDPDIYALGDCAEHRRATYGLIAPGYEQAETVARNLSGANTRYEGSNTNTRLKLNTIKVDVHLDIKQWPEERLICDCNAVSCGRIVAAIRSGSNNIEALGEVTGAATNCGSCRPLLIELLGKASKVEPPKSWLFLQFMAFVTIFIGVLYLLLPGLSYQGSISNGVRWDEIWSNSFARQITGFSLLFIAVIVSLISIRKRVNIFSWGDFTSWRNAHLILGLLIMITLLIHTGARAGENLDSVLMVCFVVVLFTGGLLTGSIANQHKFNVVNARKLRIGSLWLHLLALWPLPALLTSHVLKSYYF